MVDCVDERVDASGRFASQSRDHGHERRQHPAVAETGDEGDYEVGCPRQQKQASKCHSHFGDADLVPCLGLFTAAQ